MKDDSVCLQQIADFIDDINGYVKGKSIEDFEGDEMLQDAVIRKLELIGEAANRLSNKFIESNPDFPIREAVSLRNKLVHEYDAVSLDIIWQTVQDDIPVVKKFVDNK